MHLTQPQGARALLTCYMIMHVECCRRRGECPLASRVFHYWRLAQAGSFWCSGLHAAAEPPEPGWLRAAVSRFVYI